MKLEILSVFNWVGTVVWWNRPARNDEVFLGVLSLFMGSPCSLFSEVCNHGMILLLSLLFFLLIMSFTYVVLYATLWTLLGYAWLVIFAYLEVSTGMEPPCSLGIWSSKDQSLRATWSTSAEGWSPRAKGACVCASATSFLDKGSAPIFLLLTLFLSNNVCWCYWYGNMILWLLLSQPFWILIVHINYKQCYNNRTMAVFTFVALFFDCLI